MPKGRQKGGKRCFTNFAEEDQQKLKEEKQKAWRKARGEKSSEDEDGSSSEEEESESSEEEDALKKPKSKGVADLIEIDNPNHVVQKAKKVSSLDTTPTDKQPLSRREREEIEKQKAQAHYRKMHAQGKTEEARADLERLALIRKQREEAVQKKEEEKKAKEAAAAAKRDQVAKALNKKGKS